MRRIHVLGDLNLDLILSGMTELPALGTEILAGDHVFKAGGSSANVAVVLAMCGAPARLFACIGRDDEGALALRDLRRKGLGTRTVSRLEDLRTAVTVSLTYPQDRIYVTGAGGLARVELGRFRKGYLHPGGHLHLGSYFLQKALRTSVPGLLAAAKHAGMTTSLDPGHDPDGRWDRDDLEAALPSLDWLLPNAAEACALADTDRVADAARILGARLSHGGGLVVKSGEKGAWLWQAGEAALLPAVPAPVVDTTCAGDCFDAGFLLGLLGGRSPREAAALGNRFGALGVSCLGLPTRERLREAASA